MKVFFNHLAKCGGTSINDLARSQYGDKFHVISHSTTFEQVQKWLSMDVVFLSAEIYNINDDILKLLLSSPDLIRVILTRDPVDRFISFCTYSGVISSITTSGSSFLNNEVYLSQPLNAKDWLCASLTCLASSSQAVIDMSNDLLTMNLLRDDGFCFSIYSQFYLASFKGLCFPEIFTKSYSIPHFLVLIRSFLHKSRLTLPAIINSTLSFYNYKASLSNIDNLIHLLIKDGIFPFHIDCVPKQNQSRRGALSSDFTITSDLASRYYAEYPEDFLIHSFC